MLLWSLKFFQSCKWHMRDFRAELEYNFDHTVKDASNNTNFNTQ